MAFIDWDGGGIDFFGLPQQVEHPVGVAVDTLSFADLDSGMHVQYEASRERKVDIRVLGKVAAYPFVEATQHVPGGHTRVVRGQLRGCDDGSGGDFIELALAAAHTPLVYSDRCRPHEIRLPFALGQLFVQGLRSELP